MNADASMAIVLHRDDDVAVAARRLPAGQTIPFAGRPPLVLLETIEAGHKLALRTLPSGSPIRKFGQPIGFARTEIMPGAWVHVHNVDLGTLSHEYEFATETPPQSAPISGRTFQGYRRPDGRAGTRNYIGIVSTVNCSATASKFVAERFDESLLADFEQIDGVIPLVHKAGCAIEQGGEDHQQLVRTLAGFARHPNIGAYVVIGLGCETAQASFLVDHGGLVQLNGSSTSSNGPLVLNIQEVGGVRRTVDRAVAAIRELLPDVDRARRVPIPVSELVLGLNCGGSDGYSGVTANPALGFATDLLVAHGGTSILAETPEVIGGEHLLTRRAVSREVGQALIDRIQWWRDYVAKFDTTIDNNPSVGNKLGGLTTIYEKSLGAIAKGGTTALRAVYKYAEPVVERGFVFMDTPGYDPASVTGLIAGGANMVCFTTGRGSCYGCKPAPTVKVASNSAMYRRMEDDMDVDAGRILDGATVEEVGREIFETLIDVASGRRSKSEQQGIGEEEFCPWMPGPVL